MFFLVAIRKGVKFTDIEWISLLNSFLWFQGVEIKYREGKIRLGQRTLFCFCRLSTRELCESQLPWRGVWMAPAPVGTSCGFKANLSQEGRFHEMESFIGADTSLISQPRPAGPIFQQFQLKSCPAKPPGAFCSEHPFQSMFCSQQVFVPGRTASVNTPTLSLTREKIFPSALKRGYYGEAALWAVLQGSAGNLCSIPGWELTPELGRLHTNDLAGEVGA